MNKNNIHYQLLLNLFIDFVQFLIFCFPKFLFVQINFKYIQSLLCYIIIQESNIETMLSQKLQICTQDQNPTEFQVKFGQNQCIHGQQEKSIIQNLVEKSQQKIDIQQNQNQDQNQICDDFDQQKLIRLYTQHGSKWVKIARFFEGKSDNFIKNRFYSRLRKSVRLLNKYVSTNYKLNYKIINLNIIFKLVNLVQNKLLGSQIVPDQIITYYSKLLYELINLSTGKLTQEESILEAKEYTSQQDMVCSFEALQNLWKFLGTYKKSKSNRRSVKCINNKKFKLKVQSDQYYLVITLKKCYLTDSITADEIIRKEIESQAPKYRNQSLSNQVQTINEKKQSKTNKKCIKNLKIQKPEEENFAQILEKRMEIKEYFSSELLEIGAQNQATKRYRQIQNFYINSPQSQITEGSNYFNSQTSEILQIYTIDQDNYNEHVNMDLFDQNIQIAESYPF